MRPTSSMIAAGMLLLLHTRVCDAEPVELTFGGDRFVSGETVAIQGAIAGDLVVAGGRVSLFLDSNIAGDLLAAGRDVRHTGNAAEDAYIAGRRVLLEGTIGGNARLAGSEIRLTPNSHLAGNLSAAGANLLLEGRIDGSVLVAGRDVHLNGVVVGDVRIRARNLTLGPATRIEGVLRYRSSEVLQQQTGAVVSGGIERTAWDDDRAQRPEAQTLGLWSAGLILLSVVLLAVLPSFTRQAAATLRTRPGGSLLTGFLACLAIPIAAVLAFITIIGIPLGLVLLLSFTTVVLASLAIAAVAAGDGALRRLSPAREASPGWRSISAALAVLLLMLVASIPLIGGVLVLLALFAGIGAVLYQVRWR
jgi:cytoskeletal protein CcmA (bactofilin family)